MANEGANETTKPIGSPAGRTSEQAEAAATDAWIQRTVRQGQPEQTKGKQQQAKQTRQRTRQQT